MRPVPMNPAGARVIIRILLFTVLVTGTSPAAPKALAQGESSGEAQAPEVLVVGTKHAPPFAIRETGGVWSGLSIDLWRQVAADLGVAYEFEERTLEGLLTGLEDGSLDASVAALTMTADREARFDFSHAFFSSGLGIAVAPERGMDWRALLESFFSPALLKALGGLVLVLFFTGFLLWLFERRHNHEQFGGKPAEGLGAAFWWSAATMTTVGYGDKAPVTVGGRAVALLWMFISIITISGFTAAIASSLTLASFRAPVEGPDDLDRVRVATVRGSATEGFLDSRDLGYESYDSLDAALDALTDGEVEAVVHDAPILRFLVKDGKHKRLDVLAETFEHQAYGIGVPEGSELREPLNQALLKTLASPIWQEAQERYLGE